MLLEMEFDLKSWEKAGEIEGSPVYTPKGTCVLAFTAHGAAFVAGAVSGEYIAAVVEEVKNLREKAESLQEELEEEELEEEEPEESCGDKAPEPVQDASGS